MVLLLSRYHSCLSRRAEGKARPPLRRWKGTPDCCRTFWWERLSVLPVVTLLSSTAQCQVTGGSDCPRLGRAGIPRGEAGPEAGPETEAGEGPGRSGARGSYRQETAHTVGPKLPSRGYREPRPHGSRRRTGGKQEACVGPRNTGAETTPASPGSPPGRLSGEESGHASL